MGKKEKDHMIRERVHAYGYFAHTRACIQKMQMIASDTTLRRLYELT